MIIYIVVLFIFRIMGKRQLGQLQPFEFVITLIIADLATLPMSDKNIPLINGIVPLITLLIIQFFISVLARKSSFVRRVINGKPMVVISPNGIEYDVLKELNMNMADLQEGIRCAGVFKLEDVAYALVETNGTITVLPRSAQEPVTRQDMQINKEPNGLPRMIISDGKLIKENLFTMNIDGDMLDKIVKMSGYKSVQNITFATIDDNKNVFVQNKHQKFTTFKLGE